MIVLTNETNVGFPDAIGEWTLDRLMDNPEVDHVAARLKAARWRRGGRGGLRQAREPEPAAAARTARRRLRQSRLWQGHRHPRKRRPRPGARRDRRQLRLEPWDGGIFTASLVPEGRFAAIAANLGPAPLGFVQYQLGATGKLDLLHFWMADGQTYDFRRE